MRGFLDSDKGAADPTTAATATADEAAAEQTTPTNGDQNGSIEQLPTPED